MEFTVFAGKLHSVIGGDSTHTFTKTLFQEMVSEEGAELVEKRSAETYKAYFNGNNGITKLAKDICMYPDSTGFQEYINGLPLPTRKTLVSTFTDDIPELSTRNLGKKLAELFEEIIRDAAATKRKAPSKKNPTTPKQTKAKGNVPVSSSGQMVAVKSFSKEYYQLLVTTEPDIFDTNIITMPASRSLTQYTVPEEIYERCSSLTNDGISELMTFPALICQENTDMNGITDPNQHSVYGYIRKIQKSGKNIKILFEPLASFKQQILCDKKNALFFDLTMDCAITDLNHTAWTVHKTNLFEAFDEAGITDIPKPE